MGLMGEEYREAVGGQASESVERRVEKAGFAGLTSCVFVGDTHVSTTRPREVHVGLLGSLGVASDNVYITEMVVGCPSRDKSKCASCPNSKKARQASPQA